MAREEVDGLAGVDGAAAADRDQLYVQRKRGVGERHAGDEGDEVEVLRLDPSRGVERRQACVDVADAAVHPDPVVGADAAVRVDAGEPAVALQELRQPQPVDALIRMHVGEDEVVDAVEKRIDLTTSLRRAMPQAA